MTRKSTRRASTTATARRMPPRRPDIPGPGRARVPGRRRARRVPGRRLRGAARGRHRARLGDRHVDRRHQRGADRRQRARQNRLARLQRVLGACRTSGRARPAALLDRGSRNIPANLDDASRAAFPAFFAPNPMAPGQLARRRSGIEAGRATTRPRRCARRSRSSSTSTLRRTAARPRLTVGAVNVAHRPDALLRQPRRDDRRRSTCMASGALPPAFPAVRIDGEPYWDGGIFSNTPTEVIFDDNPRRDSLIFAVHMWNPVGPEPESMWEVMASPEGHPVLEPRGQPHRPPEADPSPAPRHQASSLGVHARRTCATARRCASWPRWGCVTRMHVVRLLAPQLDDEDHTKDIDFTPVGHPRSAGRPAMPVRERAIDAGAVAGDVRRRSRAS